MLGYVISEGRGAADRLLAEVATLLRAEGIAVAGAVQINHDTPDNPKCDMDLAILTSGDQVRISQRLGSLSRGCRLDPAGLEQAVGLIEGELRRTDASPAILIINKFGKQELDGRGFRPAIGMALEAGIPVLTSVNRTNAAYFSDWSGGLAEQIPDTVADVMSWSRSHMPLSDARTK
ncbi:MAG: DUF2478 domain-containing protein [Marivivens sp.]|nr:DUF2478 domain-containing protein [Marivivens sp.]